MPKLNARENTRNRSQAKKRERNRALRASLQAPAKARAESSVGWLSAISVLSKMPFMRPMSRQQKRRR